MVYQSTYQGSSRPATLAGSQRFLRAVQKYAFNTLLLVLGLHILIQKDIRIQVNMNGAEAFAAKAISRKESPVGEWGHRHRPRPPQKPETAAFSISNLTPVLSPDYGKRKNIPPSVIREKLNVCLDYVDEYARVARLEMREFGIPASITLAQGLLESNAGGSRLALESNNHFGIKCKSKCRGCTCRNYSDDDVYDMFRVFGKPLDSFREHSLLLNNSRYQFLHDLDRKDYHGWAHGLKKAGYATDPNYPEKLIQIIEELELYKYDR